MTITLYKIKDDRRKVDKTLNNTTKVTELTAHIKSDCDILHPVLEVAYNASIMSANYIYIADWGRYYFISNIVTGAQRIFIHADIDVLQTYSAGIKDLTCVIERQEDINKSNIYLPDYMFRAKSIKTVSTPYIFPNSPHTFTKNQSIILTTGGRS